jgi:hypothetical protein
MNGAAKGGEAALFRERFEVPYGGALNWAIGCGQPDVERHIIYTHLGPSVLELKAIP